MKRLVLLFFCIIATGLIAFAVSRQIGRSQCIMPDRRATLAWLQTEFQLDQNKAALLADMHQQYDERCAQLCKRIRDNRQALSELISTHNEATDEMNQLLQQSALIQAECRQQMLTHIYQVAALLPEKQKHRYLEIVKEQLLAPSMPHEGPRPCHP